MFFCSTIHRDQTYKKILERLETKNVNTIVYDHFLMAKRIYFILYVEPDERRIRGKRDGEKAKRQ